jgi:hypothetical protein
MQYWIFIVTQQNADGKTYSSTETYNQRMQDKFWGLGEKTPNRKNLQKADRVVFYLGNPEKSFAGTATLLSSSFQLNDSEKEKLSHGKERYTTDYGVLLTDINQWENPKNAQDLIPQLSFIENKGAWGSYFQGGIRQITEEDYEIITHGASSPKTESLQNYEIDAEFALESHLEEFIDKNWDKIRWGAKLEKYQTDDNNGRQFPAGTWSIDFLAVDKTTNDFVVIELKRGQTSDSTVGQILAYINWVGKNIAKNQQKVRGIIIAKEIDDRLKYAVMNQENIEVKTYKVDFTLFSYE